jgi:hypothetical protein
MLGVKIREIITVKSRNGMDCWAGADGDSSLSTHSPHQVMHKAWINWGLPRIALSVEKNPMPERFQRGAGFWI